MMYMTIRNERRSTLLELQAAISAKFKASPSSFHKIKETFGLIDKPLLKQKNKILLEIQKSTDELLKKKDLTKEDLTGLLKKIKNGITENNNLVKDANITKIFKVSAGRTGKVLYETTKLIEATLSQISENKPTSPKI
jgi:hypothetical protein